MAEPNLTFTRLAGASDSGDLLIFGPSLGTSVTALWQASAQALADRFEVIGWDLPGHGLSAPATAPFTIADLAAVVRRTAHEIVGGERRDVGYAGVSVAGTVGLELALEPGPFMSIACIASAARIGVPTAWRDRAALVRQAGTPVMVTGSAQRWFSPGFIERDPQTAARLLHSLSDADSESYALTCEALAAFDTTSSLPHAAIGPLIAPGEHDMVVSVELATATASSTPGARLHVMTGCAHLPPAEDPSAMAMVLRQYFEECTHA